MNFHTAEAGTELNVALAKIVGINGRVDSEFVEGPVFVARNSELCRWFGLDFDGSFGDPEVRWCPSEDRDTAMEFAEKINFFLGAMMWRDSDGDYIIDFSRKLGPRPTLSLTWVRAPTIALALCRAIGVVHEYDRVHPNVSTYTPVKMEMPVVEGVDQKPKVEASSSIIAIADAEGKVVNEVNP